MLGRRLHRKADTEVSALSSCTHPACRGCPSRPVEDRRGVLGVAPQTGPPAPCRPGALAVLAPKEGDRLLVAEGK